ncbi:coiled-coil domain-containing protein 167-like [Hetaerina americana]|uniref:coiled-coil domain-containing protein 167-like n=1 Tax=Hetaerina americana TaxID=62018 RepID=UPI003A7F2D91
MGKDKPTTIMSEMQKVQDTLKTISYRAEVLEKNLKSLHLSLDLREAMEKELVEVKKSLSEHNEQMKKLQKENTKSFTVAVMLMFITFLVFGLYKMFFESEVK